MSAGAGGAGWAERVYAALLRLYPRRFRQEYGAEMLGAFRDWSADRNRGLFESVRFGGAVLKDLVISLPREWVGEARSPRLESGADSYRPSYLFAVLAGLAVLTLYVLTLAPTTAFWDAGEYITVAHVLGIPHPPGNPLFVLLARGWEILLSPLGLPVAVRINLFSATLSAGAHALWFLVVERTLAGCTKDRALARIGAAAAVAFSATAFTVWNQSDVNEKVYTLSLFTTALVSWLLLRWRDTGRKPKTLLLVAFVVGLTATNHLMGVLVVPALLLFVVLADWRALQRPRFWLAAIPLVAVALSVQFFLPLRASQQPLVSEGAPVCTSITGAVASVYTWGGQGCEALSAVLRREQYAKPSIRADPTDPRMPRGTGLVAAQITNYLQYLDWQWARSVDGRDALFGGARPLVSLLFLALGVLGFQQHWRSDRDGAAYLGTLFLTFSVGLVVYLNFEYGYAIARDRFPDSAMHEARERDYFFLIGFSIWGLWVGIGLATLWRAVADRFACRTAWPRLAAAPILGLALVPLFLNWSWASRADDYTARDWAYNVLMSVEPYGVLVTNGDNDSFPLWYLQKVEGIRKDVTVVLSPYLTAPWYVRQIRELTTPCPPGVDPAAHPTRIVCQRPFDAGDLPAPLVEAGWAAMADPPRDSILPLSDEEIDRIAANSFVVREPLVLRAGRIETTIDPGTPLLSADTFTAAIVQSTLGKRPIHFMPGSPAVYRLGLFGYTVRQGITWRIMDAPLASPASDGVVMLPGSALSSVAGAAIDLPLSDTLLWQVYLRRGRILDPDAPWVDAATSSILLQYAYAHYAAAQGHNVGGDEAAVERHVRRARWWEGVVGG